MKRSSLIIALTVVSLWSFRLVLPAQDHNQHHPKQEKQTTTSQEKPKEVYSCPMHPEVKSDKPGKCPKCGMKLEKKSSERRSISGIMGKPTFERSVEGTKVEVWLMTQDEHKKMMLGHDQTDEGMNHDKKDGMMEAMMAGTHHVMVKATDVATEKAIDSASIKIAVTSPSKNSSMVELKNMMNHFGGGLTLDEKGAYTLDVWVSGKEKVRTVSFNYEVK